MLIVGIAGGTGSGKWQKINHNNMLDNIKVEDVMFLDIETVPQASSYELLNPLMQNLWDKKSKQFRSPDQTAEDVYEGQESILNSEK